MEEQAKKSNRIHKKTMHWKKKILLGLLIILMVGFVYEQAGEYSDSIKYKPVGQLINVNGHNMHIFVEGKGSATVVFASGWKMPSPYVDFYPLYNEISKHTRTAVYDRPGYGWSDVAGTPRDIDTITTEIHELLEKSGQKPPYILVGHSIGSLEALRFAQIYKDEVKGVVLLDGSNPDMYSNPVKPSTFAFVRASIFNNSIYLLNKSGISRLLFNTVYNYSSSVLSTARNNLSLAPGNFIKLDQAMFLKTFHNSNQVEEGKNKEKNALKVLSNGYINNIPLRIITSEELNNYKESKENQLNLKKWSTNSKQIVVKGAGHAVHWSHPEVVNAEILDILNNN